MRRLILGSESSQRRELLATMGFKFAVIAPHIDERSIRSTDPTKLTQMLAEAKSVAVTAELSRLGVQSAVVITADQVVVWNGEIREKPANEDQARKFMKDYGSGEPVLHFSSVCVTETAGGEVARRLTTTDLAVVQFLPFPEVAIAKAIKRGWVLKSAGAVVIEDPDIVPHVKAVWNAHGPSDARSSVMGLPETATRNLLKSCSYR